MMERWTIRTRLIFSYTLLFGIILSIFAAVIYEAAEDERISKLNGNLESHAEKLHSEIEEQVDDFHAGRHSFPILQDLLAIKTRGLEGERFQLYDTAWSVIVADSLLASNERSLPASALSGKTVRMRMNIGGIRYAVLWVPLEVDETVQYVVQVGAPMTEIQAELARLRLLLIISVPFVLLLGGIAAAWITGRAFRPISSMVSTAERITGTNLQDRVPEPVARDEIQHLAKTLNGMIGRIDEAFESQRQFVADASHEIRTPLTVIRSELEFAQRAITNESAQESLRISLAEIDHLARMAEKLLMLARMDASQFKLTLQPVRIDELLVECVQLMRSSAEKKRLALDVHVDSAMEIEGDPSRLKSVLLNLIDNAIKFSPERGVVGCGLAVGDRETVTLSVSDRGPGVTESDLPHIFRRFYQSEHARASGNGSGLGLAIVDRIVRLHGGSVTVDNTPGGGCTFIVRLPCNHPINP